MLVPLSIRGGAGAAQVIRRHGPAIVVLALVQVVAPFTLIAYGERHVASSLAGILVSTVPILTALIAARVDEEERPRGIALAGVAVGIAGIVLLFGLDLSGDAEALAGGLMVVLASAGYAVGLLYVKRRLRGVPPVAVAAATMVVGTLLLLPLVPFTLPARVPDLQTVLAIAGLGAGGTGIAFAIFYTLIAEIGPSRAALVTYIAPGFAVLYGVALIGEPLTAGALLGLVLILAGSYLAAERRVPGRPRP